MSQGFELVDRDGLARLGKLSTPHGELATPALLPVVHPDHARQPIPPTEMRRRFGVSAVITSAYITWRGPLREVAEREGIHALIGFDGPVMTDSGAFQQHAYGHVEVEPLEILDFQTRIGSDIATVLDRFVEPDVPRSVIETEVAETERRAREARSRRPGLLAVPVQGGTDPDLRRRSAESASAVGDVLAVGGVVPLMEQYRFADLVGVLRAVRPGLAPGRPVHLFGTGHPMLFALAALFGVDLFDSSAYHKFARRGDLLFPTGTVSLDRIREPICACRLCGELPLADLRGRPPEEREHWLAQHNLLTSLEEVGRIRQAIRDGMLWELAEQRAHGHPALLAALGEIVRDPLPFLSTEPESRRTFRVLGPESLHRPSVVAFERRTAPLRAGTVRHLLGPKPPLLPTSLQHLPPEHRDGERVDWECATALGPVPLELSELYPVGAAVAPADFFRRDATVRAGALASSEFDLDRDWTETWSQRHMRAILKWTYGAEVDPVIGRGLAAGRSRRTGRLRTISVDGRPAFTVGNDGIPRPGWFGGQLLHGVLPFPNQRVEVDADAVEFVTAGRSLFARFAKPRDLELRPGASTLLVDREDRLLAVARLLLAPHEMGSFQRGVAAWVSAHARAPQPPRTDSDDAPRPGDSFM